MNRPARDALREQAVSIDGPAGRLEAAYRPAAGSGEPAAVALLCHPNPAQGGTMHNKILYRIAKRLAVEAGVPALRFNFRGVGDSEGAHDHGRGERHDVMAALGWLGRRHPRSPVLLVGYSFGAVVGLPLGMADEHVTHLVALGIPLLGEWHLTAVREGTKPRLFVHGEHDEFGGATELKSFVEGLDGPVEVAIVPGANHLFRGREDEAVDAVVQYIARVAERA